MTVIQSKYKQKYTFKSHHFFIMKLKYELNIQLLLIIKCERSNKRNFLFINQKLLKLFLTSSKIFNREVETRE